MIRDLFAILDPATAAANRRQLGRIGVYAVAEGIAFGLTLPVIAALLRGDVAGAMPWLVALVFATVAAMAARQWQIIGGTATAIVTIHVLQRRLAGHVVALPVDWFTPARTGTLPQTLAWGAIHSGRSAPYSLIAVIGGVLTPAFVLSVAAVVDWRPAAVMAASAGLLALVHRATTATIDQVEDRTHAASAEATARVVEFAQAQPTLRASGRDGLGRRLLTDALDEQHAVARTMVVREVLARAGFGSAVELSIAALVAVIGWLLTRDGTATAVLVALLVLTLRFAEPIATLGDTMRGMRFARINLRRVRALLDVPPLPVVATPSPVPPGPLDVRIENLTFAYPGSDPALHELDLHVPAGTTTALVGPSGAGKSTILRLIARFADPQAGTVRLGGVDVRDLAPADLYGAIDVVLQDVVLTGATIRDNVLGPGGSASAEELADAARAAGLTETIARLPEGWDTPVGDGGSGLSGGERQRVALARAALHAAPVVLLDEATAALDAVHERTVGNWIDELHGRRTVIVVAHQLSTIAAADRIVVLDGGRVVESGSHQELLAAGGRYARMWHTRRRAHGWRLLGEQ